MALDLVKPADRPGDVLLDEHACKDSDDRQLHRSSEWNGQKHVYKRQMKPVMCEPGLRSATSDLKRMGQTSFNGYQLFCYWGDSQICFLLPLNFLLKLTVCVCVRERDEESSPPPIF